MRLANEDEFGTKISGWRPPPLLRMDGRQTGAPFAHRAAPVTCTELVGALERGPRASLHGIVEGQVHKVRSMTFRTRLSKLRALTLVSSGVFP